MLRITPILILSIAIFSCDSNNSGENSAAAQDSSAIPVASTSRITVTDTSQPEHARNSDEKNLPQNDAEKVRLVVSFVSRGEGIDLQTKTTFEQWLATKKNVTWNVQPWGREGELNYCFPLNNMKASEQDAFVKEVQQQLAGRSMVFVNEWTWCDNYRRADKP